MAAGTSSASTWLQDPKNRMIAIIGSVVALVVVLVVVLFASGVFGGGGSTPSSATATGAPVTAAGTSSGAPGVPAMPSGGPGPAPVSVGGGGAAAAGGGEGEQVAAAPPAGVAKGSVPSRSDPFQYNSELKRLYADMRPTGLEPTILAPWHVEQWHELYKPPKIGNKEDGELEPNEPVPPMRVAGVSFGTTLAAMLEINGQEAQLVHPGQKLKIEGNDYVVESIERDRLFLTRKVPNYRRRQRIEVGMDAPVAAPGGGMGMPGGSGMGMPGRPGGSGSGGSFGGRPFGGAGRRGPVE